MSLQAAGNSIATASADNPGAGVSNDLHPEDLVDTIANITTVDARKSYCSRMYRRPESSSHGPECRLCAPTRDRAGQPDDDRVRAARRWPVRRQVQQQERPRAG